MCAKYYENPTMLSRVTAKNVGDVLWDTVQKDHSIILCWCIDLVAKHGLERWTDRSTVAINKIARCITCSCMLIITHQLLTNTKSWSSTLWLPVPADFVYLAVLWHQYYLSMFHSHPPNSLSTHTDNCCSADASDNWTADTVWFDVGL